MSVTCPKCGATFPAALEMQGQRVLCPSCKKPMRLGKVDTDGHLLTQAETKSMPLSASLPAPEPPETAKDAVKKKRSSERFTTNQKAFAGSAMAFLVIAAWFVWPKSEPRPDFRNVRWGMSREQVKATEQAEPFIDKPGQLSYHEEFATRPKSYPVTLNYGFIGDRLAAATYEATTTTREEGKDAFLAFGVPLMRKYGEGRADWRELVTESFRKDETITHARVWPFRRTFIMLYLQELRYLETVTIRYEARNIDQIRERALSDRL